jgi:hypothetical protein
MTDEEQLVATGLQHLISVTRKPTSSKCSTKEEEKTPKDGGRHLHLCINGPPAKFLLQWRIPIGKISISDQSYVKRMGAIAGAANLHASRGCLPAG